MRTDELFPGTLGVNLASRNEKEVGLVIRYVDHCSLQRLDISIIARAELQGIIDVVSEPSARASLAFSTREVCAPTIRR